MKETNFFPLFVDLTGRKILIAGAGTVAARRAGVLAEFGADVTVVAPDGTERMQEMADSGKVRWVRERMEPDRIRKDEGWYMVLAATDQEDLNRRITEQARRLGIPANHAGDHKQCDFYFPAIIRTDDLVMGMISGKQNHRLVRRMAAQLRVWIQEAVGRTEEGTEE